MNDEEIIPDEFDDEAIPVNDKRRFTADGEMIADQEIPAEPVRSALEIALEADLKTETTRRQAAETKLVGVQAKFEEAKANLERETGTGRGTAGSHTGCACGHRARHGLRGQQRPDGHPR